MRDEMRETKTQEPRTATVEAEFAGPSRGLVEIDRQVPIRTAEPDPPDPPCDPPIGPPWTTPSPTPDGG